MRVLVATTVHQPLDARIHHRQIRALRAAGVAVTYAAPWAASGTHTGRAAPGVVPVDLPRAAGRRRLTALRRARRVLRALGPQHDLILLHDPELFLAVRGRLRELPPVVLDVHEDLPASLTDRTWIPRALVPPARRLASALEAAAERELAGLLLAERSYASRFAGDHAVVENLPWLPAEPPPAATHHRVVYLGRLSAGRGTLELLSMARTLALDPWNPRVELIGRADADVAAAVRRAHERGIVTWHGFLPNDEALRVVAGSVAGLAPLRDLGNYRGSMPTKVFEYLAHGVPAVVTPLPEAVEVIRASDGGEVVPFRSAQGLVDAVRGLALDPARARRQGVAGRAHVQANASWDGAAPRFVAQLAELAGLPAPELPAWVAAPTPAGAPSPDAINPGHSEVAGRIGPASPVPTPAPHPVAPPRTAALQRR